MTDTETGFGEYMESLRKNRGKSIRKTAAAIGVSPQFCSEVEKNRRSALTGERLKMLKNYLELTLEEYQILCTKAAKASRRINIVVPYDIAEYVMERPYVIEALRILKKMDADEADWKVMLDSFMSMRLTYP